MTHPMSDNERVKIEINELLKRLSKAKKICDAEFYHYQKSKVIGTINFCESAGLITGDEAAIFHNRVNAI